MRPLLIVLFGPVLFAGSSILAEYHFDQEDFTTGPDTMLIVARSKGTVRLTEQYRVSGHRSLEIRAVAGDSDFPEWQGYFSGAQVGDGGDALRDSDCESGGAAEYCAGRIGSFLPAAARSGVLAEDGEWQVRACV